MQKTERPRVGAAGERGERSNDPFGEHRVDPRCGMGVAGAPAPVGIEAAGGGSPAGKPSAGGSSRLVNRSESSSECVGVGWPESIQRALGAVDQIGHDRTRLAAHELRRDAQARDETEGLRLAGERTRRPALDHPPRRAVHSDHREAPTAAEWSFDVGHAPDPRMRRCYPLAP